MSTMTLWWLAYPVLGMVTGVFAGLFGVGGGTVLVPALVMLYAAQGFSQEVVMHLALGTSMATIIFTAMASTRAHHKRGSVLWPVVAKMTPGVIVGALLGSMLVAQLPTRALAAIFVLFVCYAALQMFFDFKPRSHRSLPGAMGSICMGILVGFLSCLMAIGGGVFVVLFMTWCSVEFKRAIGTSAAVGVPVALFGTLGYIMNGWHNQYIPPISLGYVHLPALIGLCVASMLTAPLGVRLAHHLPLKTLKRLFACMLVLLAFKTWHGIFWT